MFGYEYSIYSGGMSFGLSGIFYYVYIWEKQYVDSGGIKRGICGHYTSNERRCALIEN